MGRITFLIGGERSGKSAYAVELANRSQNKVIYLAPGVPCDDEMVARIETHKKNRPPTWQVVEEPLNIETALKTESRKPSPANRSATTIIFDCLTIWVSNLLLHYQNNVISDIETKVINRVSYALSIIQNLPSDAIIVSNEVGMGIVPETALGRRFRDILGKSNQLVANAADEVLLLIAGVPMKVK